MQKRWVVKQADENVVTELQSTLGIHPVLCKLLVQRGVKTFDEARTFFRPSLEQLHDPFLMKNMDKAISRIEKAFGNGEKILIYGDYDVDGTTSVALVYSFFRTIYPTNIDYYIPNRYTEGYGISTAGIDYAKEKNITLIIALDCGIKSIDKIDYANSLNIDFIICDHHLPGDEVPKAHAVLDPKQIDCNYPFKELSGCGIGFKLIQAYSQKNNLPLAELENYLDLVTVSIASDIVPITGENRVLAHFGLKKINTNPSKGLKALKEICAVKKDMSISDIVFVLGPRINAAGRMDDAKHAVRLLLAETSENANSGADILNKKNVERREHDLTTTEEALAMLDDVEEQQNKKSTVLYQPHWHKGVIGIVASRLMDSFYRPTIILTKSNGHVAGSARSVHGFNIYEAIKECSDLLDQYGGHFFAAGLTMQEENVEAFTKKFEEVVSRTITEDSLTPEILIDAEIELEDLTQKFYNIAAQFSPFGPDNMKPVFVTRHVTDSGFSRIVGQHHIKMAIKKKNSVIINGIAFGMHEKIKLMSEKKEFDICYTIEENEWNGQKKLEINVRDLK